MIHPILPRVLLIFGLLSIGCDQPKPPTQATPSSTKQDKVPSKQASERVKSPDSTRIKAASSSIPKTPQRIVSLAPNLTEILFALGVGDRVVGVTKYCDYPKEVSKLPKVGGFNQPDMETMIGLGPDLVLGMASGPTQTLPAKLDALKLSYVFTQMDTIAQTYEGILVVGELVGKSERARTLVDQMKRSLVKVERNSPAPSTLFVLGHKPMVISSTGSFGAELVQLAGGKLAFSNGNPYPVVDMELVLKLSPEVIVDTTMTSGPTTQAFWSKHPSIRAVSKKRVHTLNDPALLRPGPRLIEAHRIMTSLISPGALPAKEAAP